MTVSIIIAVKTWQKNLKECVAKCKELDYPEFEIIILPDNVQGQSSAELIQSNSKRTVPVKVVPTGPVSPAAKRDIAIAHSQADILAFLDDDAYPERDWLKKAIENFKNQDAAAVGGPAVTPPSDNLRQRASGAIYSSFLVSSKYVYRYLPKKRREVEDYPSCNFFIRKSVMQELGGFNTNFWPGEDTKLCLDIIKLGKKIIYDPQVLVYHHRRPLFIPHLKQMASYALHRGYFAKKYPQTSLKGIYFLPSIFIIGLMLGGIISLYSVFFRMAYFLGLSVYLLLTLIFSFSRELRLIPFIFSGIILSHLAYGLYFLKGLLSRRLKEEL